MDLPMIEFASSLFNKNELKDCYIIGVQHILPSTHSMFKELLNKGIKKENIALLGKCYSTNHDTFDSMIEEGIDICKLSKKFDSHENYDEAFKRKIHHFLSQRKHLLNSSKFKKIIILDDGGELLEELNHYIDDYSKIVAIEQTSSGYNRLIGKKYSFPIINLARSEAKLSIEYPRVISNALKRIVHIIKETKQKVKKILIMGNGKMGAALFNALNPKYEVLRFDKKAKSSDLTEKELIQTLPEIDMIIGCSGVKSLPKEHHKHLKQNTILVSLSSSDREFDTVHLRKSTQKTTYPWSNIHCKNVILVNNGFPVSFDNNDMDDSYFFQFTRSLIMAAISQAMKTSNMIGFLDLDNTLQKMMVDEFQKI